MGFGLETSNVRVLISSPNTTTAYLWVTPTRLKEDADEVGYHAMFRKAKGTVHFLIGRDEEGRNIVIGVV
jgi:ATP sulfurylase